MALITWILAILLIVSLGVLAYLLYLGTLPGFGPPITGQWPWFNTNSTVAQVGEAAGGCPSGTAKESCWNVRKYDPTIATDPASFWKLLPHPLGIDVWYIVNASTGDAIVNTGMVTSNSTVGVVPSLIQVDAITPAQSNWAGWRVTVSQITGLFSFSGVSYPAKNIAGDGIITVLAQGVGITVEPSVRPNEGSQIFTIVAPTK